MKKLTTTLLLLFPLSSISGEYLTFIRPGTYEIATERNLQIKKIELGLKCKVYSKLRIIGVPISTKVFTTKKKTTFNHMINKPDLTNLYLNTRLTLSLPMNELTSYVHACSFIADIKVEKDGKLYERNNLSLSDFTVHSNNHDASFDLKNTLYYRTLEINKYTHEIVFY